MAAVSSVTTVCGGGGFGIGVTFGFLALHIGDVIPS